MPPSYQGDLNMNRINTELQVRSNKAKQHYYGHTKKIAEDSPENSRNKRMAMQNNTNLQKQIQQNKALNKMYHDTEIEMGK